MKYFVQWIDKELDEACYTETSEEGLRFLQSYPDDYMIYYVEEIED